MQDSAPSRPSSPVAPPASRLGLALVAALALLATWEAAAALIGPRRTPKDSDWQAAAAEVRAAFRPGDLIVFAPPWTDPVGRLHLGDLIPPQMAARADASRYGRIWEVSLRGARSAETLAEGAYPAGATTHGAVKVALYTRGAAIVPLYDFTAHAGDARVTQVARPGDSERPCLHESAEAFRCSGSRVERRTLEVDFAPHQGILAPADGALTTRVEFRDVPLGNSLTGYTGMHDWHARKFGAGPVDFKLFVDDTQLLAERHDSHDGWRPFTIATLRFAGERHAVRFEVSAPAASRERTLGFHAESRSEAPPAGAVP